ncbi:MAG TPA: sulfatase-like hydrolase/transferase [Polyangiaceae bacterium]|nr:sulfatase-like hydrolase/transferase [Polyangiaceae bacterium]
MEAPRREQPEPLRARVRRWLSPWRQAGSELPPPPEEVGIGTVLGAALVAITNAVAIEIAVSLPPAGWSLRVQHHFFDALQVIGVGACLGLAAWLMTRLKTWRGWILLALASIAAMYAILLQELERQANMPFDGAIALLLLPLYLLLCGLAVPAAYLLGALLARIRGGRWVALLFALAGIVVSHATMRDDHPGVHAAIFWVAMCLGGVAFARGVRWRRVPLAAIAVVAVVAVAWAPPNAVRVELFREPGAVAAWVLAQTVWRPPAIAASAEAPSIGAIDPEVMRKARLGLPDDPVVVFISIDAFRADVLREGRYDKQLPQLAYLRDRGAYFPRFTSGGSQTSVSLATMFSCRYYSELTWAPFGEGRSRFLYPAADQTPRFPETLTAAGVETAAFLGLKFLQGRFGIARGFAEEKAMVDDRRHAAAVELLQPLLSKLERAGEGSHFFYAHVMEPHEPYDRGAIKTGNEFDRYVSEIGVVDGWLRRILRTMRRRFRHRGYIIVTSDHGEAFGEHGTRFHTKTLYEELIAVPFILWGPSIPARRVEARASLIDVGPTVMHMFNLEAPGGCAGRSLLPLARGLLDELPRPVMAEGRLRRVIYQDDLKIIEDSVRKTVEAYDLKVDPDETDNIFDRDRARVEPAVAALRAFFHARVRPGYDVPYKP